MPVIMEVYNNISQNPRLIAKWGFSCYHEEARTLFDTGGDGGVLLHNLDLLGISCTDIDTLVLSHDHWDHNGGLSDLLKENPSLDVWILEEFSGATKALVRAYTHPSVADGWTEISRGVFSTGALGAETPEQALVIEASGGLLVITGCAHPHIAAVLEIAGREGHVWGAMGGFHTMSPEDITSLSSLSYLSPSHCTEALEEIRHRFPDSFVEGGAGKIHHV